MGVPDAALVPLWRRQFPDLAGRLGPGDAGAGVLARLHGAVALAAADLSEDVPGLARIEGWDANLVAFADALAELRAAFERESAAVFVERLRTSLAFEAGEAGRHLGAWRLANLDRFFRGLAEALEETGGDRAAVLSHLRRAVTEEREHEEGRPRAAAADAVHVTTIHKAKGLDWEHVYVLQLQKGSRQDDPKETRVCAAGGDFEYRLCGVASLGFHGPARRRAEIERHERVRLLYVALTRARRRLVLAGHPPHGRSGPPKTFADLWALRDPAPPPLAALMAEAAGSGGSALRGDVLWSFPALAAPAQDAPAPSEPRARPDPDALARAEAQLAQLRADAGARAARPFHGVASQDRPDAERALDRLHAEEERRRPAAAARDEGRERRIALAVGSAVHAGLERFALGGDLADERHRFARELETALPLAIGSDEVPIARTRALELFDLFCAGPLRERLLRLQDAVVARELPVWLAPEEAGSAPVGFWSGSIDLLYWDAEAGEYVVADYKTDRVGARRGPAARRALRAAGSGLHPSGAARLRARAASALRAVAPGRGGGGPPRDP